MAESKEIILYHYSFSPYARRIVWYLNLRKIPYLQCLQPAIMPRPDIAAIGTNYRRIPILSIGRDIYNDTRLILSKLEILFPTSSAYPAISSPSERALEKLFQTWAIDGGLFQRAIALLPTSLPLYQDPKFTKDREDYTGKPTNKEALEKLRPEALVEMREAFKVLEERVLADGREWVLGSGEGPTLADIEAVWIPHWMKGVKGALPPNYVSATQFPKTYAYIERFDKAVKAAIQKSSSNVKTIQGDEALQIIESSEFGEKEGEVEENEPTGLKKGTVVEVWPVDFGASRRDRGKLVGLDGEEIVVEGKTKNGKEVRIHAPRHGFKISDAKGESSKI